MGVSALTAFQHHGALYATPMEAPVLNLYRHSHHVLPAEKNTDVMMQSNKFESCQLTHILMLQWQPSYPCSGCGSSCGLLQDLRGEISDGSGSSNYQDNANCEWMIAPAAASLITLRLSRISTQPGVDIIRVFQCTDIACSQQQQLAELSGSYFMPQAVTSTTGYMRVTFRSDGSVNADGFTAAWTTVGPLYLSERYSLFDGTACKVLQKEDFRLQ
jgi:hypothetical protein